MDDVIALIKTSFSTSDTGIQKKEKASKEVFTVVKSVSRSEFFEGGRNGLRPQIVFTVSTYDYDDETEIVWRGKPYKVYRTYMAGDFTSLYCEKREGI